MDWYLEKSELGLLTLVLYYVMSTISIIQKRISARIEFNLFLSDI